MNNEVNRARQNLPEIKYDPEDKSNWCGHGQTKEVEFDNRFCKNGPCLPFELNPLKKTNPFVRDMVCTSAKYSNVLGDPKCQETPFFIASKRFGVVIQFEITSNLADHYNYTLDFERGGKETKLFYWLRYLENKKGLGKTVYAMEGIWMATTDKVIDNYRGLHISSKRQIDPKDNKCVNLVLDVRDYKAVFVNCPLSENKEILNKLAKQKSRPPRSLEYRLKEIEEKRKIVEKIMPKEVKMLDWLKNEIERREVKS